MFQCPIVYKAPDPCLHSDSLLLNWLIIWRKLRGSKYRSVRSLNFIRCIENAEDSSRCKTELSLISWRRRPGIDLKKTQDQLKLCATHRSEVQIMISMPRRAAMSGCQVVTLFKETEGSGETLACQFVPEFDEGDCAFIAMLVSEPNPPIYMRLEVVWNVCT